MTGDNASPGPPEPTTPTERPEGRRSPIRHVRVEVIPATGHAADELDARQNAAIKEILQWLQRQRTDA